MRIYKAKDYEEMSRKAAGIVSAQIIMKPDCVLGLATGSTPVGLYKQLIEWYRNGDLDFYGVRTPDGMEPDSEKECRRYEELIQSMGSVDLQLLGIGHNGHIGFNEPADAFDKLVHCVNLTQSTIEANKRFFASAEEVPRQAYTMGIQTIMRSKKILIIANGEGKADIVRDAFFGPVLQLHNDVTLVADEAALSKIPASFV